MIKETFPMRAGLWLSGVALLALAACASDPSPNKLKRADPVTPTEQYAIEVAPAPLELKLAAHGSGLSPTQADALRDFYGRWADGERGAITLKAPEHGPDPAATYRTVTDTRDFLIAAGVDATDIRIVGYEAGGDAAAPVRVGFMRYEATGPDCGTKWEDLARVAKNKPYAQYGCAVTANMAAQIADPSDLLSPRPSEPPDAIRRETVLDKYRQGMTTSAQKDQQAVASPSSGTTGQQ
jgi:pilus assembly protein CpaD